MSCTSIKQLMTQVYVCICESNIQRNKAKLGKSTLSGGIQFGGPSYGNTEGHRSITYHWLI